MVGGNFNAIVLQGWLFVDSKVCELMLSCSNNCRTKSTKNTFIRLADSTGVASRGSKCTLELRLMVQDLEGSSALYRIAFYQKKKYENSVAIHLSLQF